MFSLLKSSTTSSTNKRSSRKTIHFPLRKPEEEASKVVEHHNLPDDDLNKLKDQLIEKAAQIPTEMVGVYY